MEIYSLPTCVDLPNESEELIQSAKDWTLFHGGGMRSRSNISSYEISVIPFTLLPSTFPKVEFKRAITIQPILNELIHKAAHSHDFLLEALNSVIDVDVFTKRLFDIYLEVLNEGPAQSVSLGLFRSDYMLEFRNEPKIIKQVEFNTVASSFAGSAVIISQYHRFILERLGHFDLLNRLPENKALSGLCEGLIEAWKLYNNECSVILFVVEDVTYNICDQRFHEYEIFKQVPHLKVIRKTLTDIYNEGRLSNDKKLFVGEHEISVVYYRAGYTPVHYHSDNEWGARLMVERSLAIKCPSIQYHLAGTKKVQQVLTKTKWLKKFLEDDEKVKQVAEIFTSIFSLDLNDEGDVAVKMAFDDPQQFVMKPQREGGGNNVYGDDITEKLNQMKGSQERSSWILMKRIMPPVQHNCIIKPETSSLLPVINIVSELGIFGIILGDKYKISINKQVGHMVRSKESNINEGGIAFGAGCLDSPYLV